MYWVQMLLVSPKTLSRIPCHRLIIALPFDQIRIRIHISLCSIFYCKCEWDQASLFHGVPRLKMHYQWSKFNINIIKLVFSLKLIFFFTSNFLTNCLCKIEAKYKKIDLKMYGQDKETKPVCHKRLQNVM